MDINRNWHKEQKQGKKQMSYVKAKERSRKNYKNRNKIAIDSSKNNRIKQR